MNLAHFSPETRLRHMKEQVLAAYHHALQAPVVSQEALSRKRWADQLRRRYEERKEGMELLIYG